MGAVIRGEVISRHDEQPPGPAGQHRRKPPREVRARIWAAKIRAEMGWAGCGDPAHRIDTPYRRANKLPPVDECKLRDLARRQLAGAEAAETAP